MARTLRQRIQRFSLGLLNLMVIGYAQSAYAEVTPRTGLWKYEIQGESAQTGKIPKTVIQHCLTEDDVKKGHLMQQGKQNQQGCQMQNIVRKGDQMSYTMKCPSMTMQARYTMMGDTRFVGESDAVVTAANPPMKMKSRMEASYLGPCKTK